MPRSQRRILLAVRLSSGVAPICGSVDLQGFAGLRRTDDRFQHRHAMDRIRRWQRIGGPAVDGTGEGLEFRPLLVELRKFDDLRSEEHTSELQSLMRISYAVFCLKK